MTKYGRSPWVDGVPKARIPAYPRQRGFLESPVVIVGGGLTGCATAYAFAAAGVDVVLVEAGQLGHGSTGSSSGWINGDPGVPFGDVEKALGVKAARHAFRAWRRAALDCAALVRRLDVRCHLEPRTSVTVATTPEQAVRLARDVKARGAAGLDASPFPARTAKRDLALDTRAGMKDAVGGVVQPYRLSLGLAAAAVGQGATIFERSPVQKITFTRKHADVVLTGGAIRTSRVILATGVPTALCRSLVRHFWFKTRYCALTARVPAPLRRQLGIRTAVVRDCAEPAHVVRWVDDERLFVMGADAVSPPERQRPSTIVQRTGQLMYELSMLYPDISGLPPDYGWDAPYSLTSDGLPFIGPHRNFPHQLFALGDASHGVTGAYLASRLLLRYYQDELDAGDELFAFTRHER
jgi:glycine/D-amino acid oxidase-like deaminating enzyme